MEFGLVLNLSEKGSYNPKFCSDYQDFEKNSLCFKRFSLSGACSYVRKHQAVDKLQQNASQLFFIASGVLNNIILPKSDRVPPPTPLGFYCQYFVQPPLDHFFFNRTEKVIWPLLWIMMSFKFLSIHMIAKKSVITYQN